MFARILSLGGALLAFTALALPSALAATSPDDRSFARAPALERSATLSRSPDDRAFSRALGPIDSPASVQVVVTRRGFDWGDATVDAGGAAGIAALLLGAALLGRGLHHRHDAHPTLPSL